MTDTTRMVSDHFIRLVVSNPLLVQLEHDGRVSCAQAQINPRMLPRKLGVVMECTYCRTIVGRTFDLDRRGRVVDAPDK